MTNRLPNEGQLVVADLLRELSSGKYRLADPVDVCCIDLGAVPPSNVFRIVTDCHRCWDKRGCTIELGGARKRPELNLALRRQRTVETLREKLSCGYADSDPVDVHCLHESGGVGGMIFRAAMAVSETYDNRPCVIELGELREVY